MAPKIRLRLAFTETGDGKALRDFYGDVLGLELRKQFGDSWIEYATEGAHIAVHQPAGLAASEGPRLYLSFEVEGLDELHARLTSAGVKCSPIRNPDRGRFFTCQDPAGNYLHFIEFDKTWREATSY